jgi:hypothetical protein
MVPNHPNPRIKALAEAWTKHIAVELGIETPSISCFERAPYAVARAAYESWAYSQLPWSSAEINRTCTDCEYFWADRRAEDPAQTDHHGMIPPRSPSRFRLKSGLDETKTLHAGADECFHLFQDHRCGPEWREVTDDAIVEEEAHQYPHSKAEAIQSFISNFCG